MLGMVRLLLLIYMKVISQFMLNFAKFIQIPCIHKASLVLGIDEFKIHFPLALLSTIMISPKTFT